MQCGEAMQFHSFVSTKVAKFVCSASISNGDSLYLSPSDDVVGGGGAAGVGSDSRATMLSRVPPLAVVLPLPSPLALPLPAGIDVNSDWENK